MARNHIDWFTWAFGGAFLDMYAKSRHAGWRLLMTHHVQLFMRNYAYITYVLFVHCQASSKLTYGSGDVIVLVTWTLLVKPCQFYSGPSHEWNEAIHPSHINKNGRLVDILPYHENLSYALPRQNCWIGHPFKVEGRGTGTTVTSESISPTLKGHHFWSNATRLNHIHLHCWIWLFPSQALCIYKFGILCWHEFRMLILSRLVRNYPVSSAVKQNGHEHLRRTHMHTW